MEDKVLRQTINKINTPVEEWDIDILRARYKDLEQSSKETINILTNKLEQVVDENNQLKEDNSQQWEERCRLAFKVDDSIPISVIQNKIDELKDQYKSYVERWKEAGRDKLHPFYRYLVRIDAEIEILQELLEERNK